MQGTKKVKRSPPEEEKVIPKKMWVNFINNQNECVGRVDVALDAGPKQFQ